MAVKSIFSGKLKDFLEEIENFFDGKLKDFLKEKVGIF